MVVRDGDFVLVHHHRVLFPSSLSRKTRRNTPRNARIGAPAVVTFFRFAQVLCVCEESQSCSSSRIVVACWCLLFWFREKILCCTSLGFWVKNVRGNEKNIPLVQFLLTFICCGTCGDFFVSRATPRIHTSSLSLALSSSRCFCGRSFFLSSLSKKDQQTRFGFLLIFCAQIGNFQRENIIETQLCAMFPRARS